MRSRVINEGEDQQAVNDMLTVPLVQQLAEMK